MRYLITGGAGFLGINLARHLLARGHEVSSIDLQRFDYYSARPCSRFPVIQID